MAAKKRKNQMTPEEEQQDKKRRLDLFNKACKPDIFLVGTEENVEPVPAHKAFLCRASPVIAEMFEHDDAKDSNRLEMKYRHDSLRVLAHYALTGECDWQGAIVSSDLVAEVMTLAHAYDIPDLMTLASKHFSFFSTYSCNLARNISRTCDFPALEKKAKKWFRADGPDVVLKKFVDALPDDFTRSEFQKTMVPAYWSAVAEKMNSVLARCPVDDREAFRKHQRDRVFGFTLREQLRDVDNMYLQHDDIMYVSKELLTVEEDNQARCDVCGIE